MIPLSSAIPSGLTWSKPSRRRTYELRQNNELVGSLERASFWSCNHVAQTQSARWAFRRTGIFGTGAEIRDESSQQPIATFKSNWGSAGGTLTFVDGQAFEFQCRGWWRPVWSVLGAGGTVVLTLNVRERTVQVQPGAGVTDSRMALLVMFTWCRVLQAEEDAASAAVIAAV